MAIVRPGDLYHLGVVVDDVMTAAHEISEVTGTRWTHPIEFEQWMRFGGIDREIEFVAMYSLDAPHYELIQAIPGTPLGNVTRENAVHHVGYWANDFHADIARLRELGFTEEVLGLDEHLQPWGFAYFLTPGGRRIEIADRSAFEPTWDGFLLAHAQDKT